MLIVLAALLLSSHVDDATPTLSKKVPEPMYIAKPVWKHVPTGKEIQRFYPVFESIDEIDSTVIMSCQIIDKRGHLDCYLLSETPVGHGLGAAFVKMYNHYGRINIKATQGARIGQYVRVTQKMTY
eukprot:gene21669-27559_t